MPQYLLRFRVESCLTRQQDLDVSYGEHQTTFLFSKKRPEDKHVSVQVAVEATNNRLAQGIASSKIVPPVLDALSFSTGTPLLLRDCDLILKDEAGSQFRRVIYAENKWRPRRVPLTADAIRDASQMLSFNGAPRLPLCWHRYALDRRLVPEQFVFQWLAFEGLAGDVDIPSRCPKCQEVLHHCDTEVNHRGSNKVAARDIFLEANPDTTPSEFNARIWGDARNSVFHGQKYPEPEYLAELASITSLLSKATSEHIIKLFRLTRRETPRLRCEEESLMYLFIQWRTGDASACYAADWPGRILQQISREEPEGIAVANREGVDLLNYNTESPDW
jgi:hypothetical protein